MDNPYAAVFRTHFRRPTGMQDGLLPALGFLFFASAFAMAVIVPRHSRPDLFTAFTVGIGVALTGAGLWTKLREQLLSDRRRLWPDFVAPHVLVFAALSFGVTCLVPLPLAEQAGLSAIGLMAFVAALFACTGWFVALPSPLSQILGLASFSCLICAATGHWLWDMLSSQNLMAATLLFAAAAIACTATVLRMLAMTEDHPRYAQGPWPGFEQAGLRTKEPAFMAGQYPRWWPTPRLRMGVLVPSGAGLIARSRRWRAVVKLNWVFYVYLPGINVAMSCLIQHGNASGVIRSSTLVPSVIYLLFPAAMVSISWIKAWPCLELDSLRPVTRTELIPEIGAAIAVQTLQGWAIAAAIFTIGAVSLHVPTVFTASILFGSFATQPLAFGIAAWAMRYRSAGLQWLLCMPLIIPISLLAFLQDSTAEKRLLVTCIAGCALALIGIGLTKRASRLWLETELG